MSYLQTGINLGNSGIKNKMKMSVHFLLPNGGPLLRAVLDKVKNESKHLSTIPE